MTWFISKVPLLQSAVLVIPLVCAYSIHVHIRIYFLVKKTRAAIRSSEVSRKRKSSSCDTNCHDNRKDVQAACLTALMLASLCICYLPYFGLQISRMVYRNRPDPLLHTALPVVLLIGATKSLINPLLYYCQKQAIRDNVSKISTQVARTLSRDITEHTI